ncbi:hypothetical protein TSMEX_008984 [Taenia solium]|eukprot:TsM_000695900 transcript=TsM_000695900 gene=TsM_000695900
MELDLQSLKDSEVHDVSSNPPDISISLTSPYINIGLNAPLLVDSLDSPNISCYLTLYNSRNDFGFGSAAEKSECETFRDMNSPPALHHLTNHQNQDSLTDKIAEELDDAEIMSRAALRIQSWWRRILQCRKLEEAALRRLFAEQKKRMLERSTSINQSTLLKSRAIRSPKIATRIMKKMKGSELSEYGVIQTLILN